MSGGTQKGQSRLCGDCPLEQLVACLAVGRDGAKGCPGATGPRRLYQTMDAASTCLIKNNNLRWVTDTPIFLGEGAQACRLVNNHE